VVVGVPTGTKEEQKSGFAKALKAFDKALAKLRRDARTGTNAKPKNLV
jgi:hypothetical protein